MKTITIFLWCLVGLVLGTVVALGQNPTPIANLQRATTVYTTNIIPVVTNPGQTNGTKGVELDDFLASLVGFPGWPSVSVTNAIGTVKTNGTTLTASATSINFVQGSNTVVRATNSAGAVSIEINAAASGSASVNTNLQLQSLKVFGNQTNVGNLAFGTNYYWTDSGVNTLQLVDPKRGGAALTFEGSDGGITFGINATATPYIDVLAPLNAWASFNLPGHNIAVGRVWTATNASTGAGEWQAVGGGAGGGSGIDLHIFTNGALALIATNVNFQTGITGAVSGTTLNLGVDSRQITNLNWALVASTTNVVGVSNNLQTLLVANDTTTSNALRTTFIANDTTTSNGVMSQLTLAASNRVQLAAGSGGITVNQSGSGGIQTWTINDDDAGSGSSLSYAAIPTSGIVGGATLGWTTNLSANLLIVPSNLTANVHYLIDVQSSGYVASISNYQSIYFRDSGLGGTSALGTNGSSTLEIWKDTPSGTTNAILHGPEYSLLPGSGTTFTTNNLNRTIAVSSSGGGIPALPLGPSWGSVFASDGEGTTNWISGDRGGWIFTEEFESRVDILTSGQFNNLGKYWWHTAASGTLPATPTSIALPLSSDIGIVSLSLTQATSSLDLRAMPNSSGSTRLLVTATNQDIFVVTSIYIGNTNDANDVTTLWTGLGDNLASSGATLLDNNGIGFFQNTNATNTIIPFTRNSSSATFNYPGIPYATGTRMFLAWYSGRWFTNVVFFAGTNFTSLSPFATNTANIPGGRTLTPRVHAGRMTTSSGAVLRTNYVSSMHIWRRYYD